MARSLTPAEFKGVNKSLFFSLGAVGAAAWLLQFYNVAVSNWFWPFFALTFRPFGRCPVAVHATRASAAQVRQHAARKLSTDRGCDRAFGCVTTPALEVRNLVNFNQSNAGSAVNPLNNRGVVTG
jgi:hypothetical protein